VTRERARALAILAFAAAVVMRAAGQAPAGTARITSPENGSYVMGAVRLMIAFEPLSIVSQVRQVRWFANGRQICTADIPPFSCEWDAGGMVSEHVIRAVAVLKEGRQLVANSRTKAVEFAEAVDVDVIQITAVVTDGDGRFVSGLSGSNFKVYEDDKLQKLSDFAAENIPLELVTAIDVSSSMTNVLPDVRRHATTFLAQLRPDDQVTLLGFNENIITLARRSTDQAARARAIDRLRPWGGTALYDVIIHALGVLGRQSGRRSLVVFSDGEDQSSRANATSVIQRAEASDATIYMIGQGRSLKAASLQQLMRRLATGSGGRAFFTDQQTKLESIFQEIIEDLRHQYLLSYPAPDNARDGKLHRIRVEVPGHGYTVRAREGYRLTRRNPQ
jgi:Ca-activated chloride channel family protein